MLMLVRILFARWLQTTRGTSRLVCLASRIETRTTPV